MYHSDSGLLQEPRRLTTFYFLHGKVQSFLFIYTPLDSLSEKGALSIDFSQCCFFHCNQGRRVFSLGNRAITEVWRRRQKKTNGTTWIFYRNRMKTFWYEKWSAFQVLSKISKVVTSFILSFLDVKPYFLLVVNLILIWKLDYLFQNGSVSQF